MRIHFKTDYEQDVRLFEDNITMAYYEAGHMMYTHKPSLKQLSGDLKKFIRHAAG